MDFQTQDFDTAMVTTPPFISRQHPLSSGTFHIEEEGDGPAPWVLNTALQRMGQKTGLEMTGQPVGDRSETGSGYSVSDPTGSGAMATVTKGEKHLSDHFDDFQDNAPHRRAGGTA